MLEISHILQYAYTADLNVATLRSNVVCFPALRRMGSRHAGPRLFGRSCWRLVGGPELRPAEIEQAPCLLWHLVLGDWAMCGRLCV